VPGLAGSGRGSKKQRFLIKILLKSIDFECRGWPGAAGGQKELKEIKRNQKKIKRKYRF